MEIINNQDLEQHFILDYMNSMVIRVLMKACEEIVYIEYEQKGEINIKK